MGSFLSQTISLFGVLIASILFVQVLGIPLDNWDRSDLADGISNGTNSSDPTILTELGGNEEFLIQLQQNLQKAIEEERIKADPDRFRQGFPGGGGGNGGGNGGIGDFFGVGGNNGNGNLDEEDDDEDAAPAAAGPGAAGVLTGLFGLFSGIGTLNPRRVLQSTVNFFPPDQRQMAQMALEMVFGIQNTTKPTLPPTTNAPAMLLFKDTPSPAVGNSTPVSQAPLTAKATVDEVPMAETPVAETPMAEVPMVETPKVDIPMAEVPMAETPTAEVQMVNVPLTELPGPISSEATKPNVQTVTSTKKPVMQINEGVSDEDAEIVDPVEIASLEKEFAETVEKLKLLSSKLAIPEKTASIAKDFAETGSKLTLIV